MKKIRVGMNETNISTNEIPIIGTDSLGPCVGVLIYSKKNKRSLVFHASTEWKELVVQSLILLAENEIISYENLKKSLENLFLHDKYDLYDFDPQLKQELIIKKGLNITDFDETLEVTIIPGYYKDNYKVALNITKLFIALSPLFIVKNNDLPKNAVRTVMFDDLGSHEFFFDSETGKFVTEKIKNTQNTNEYRI